MSVSKDPKFQYLKQRGGRAGTWYLNHPIPKDLQANFLTRAGVPQTHLVRALGTADPVEAYRRKVVLLPQVLAEFDAIRRSRGPAPQRPAEVSMAFAFREQLRTADEELANTLAGVICDVAERIHDAGHDPAQARRSAEAFVKIAEGAETLAEAFDEWLARGTLPVRTRSKYRTALEEFAGFLGGTPLVPDMNRPNALRYVDWLNSEARSQRTKKVVPLSYNSKRDRVMALSAFWNKGLSARGKTTDQVNPWSKLEITEKPVEGAVRWDSIDNTGRPKRRPDFDDADLLAILDAPGPRVSETTRYGKRTLLEVLALGLLTGARPDEICSLHLADVRPLPADRGFLLSFEEAKNPESDRRIPVVHPLAVGIIERRIGERSAKTAQLFEEFRVKKGSSGGLAELVLRALGRHLARATDLTPGAVPYCTRHTLTTRMGNRDDVKDAVLKRYVGHKPEGMTDKHYRSITADALLGFARRVQYPVVIERRLAEELGLESFA